MGKKIVVFGCDNTGKTTLCNDLKYLFRDDGKKVEIVKSIGANKPVEQYVAFMKDNLSRKHNIIFDRFPIIEEATCGKVLRDNDVFEKWQNKDIDTILNSVDYYILCYPGLFNVLNWKEREQMDGVKENVLALINAYNEMAVSLKMLGLNVLEFNYTATSPTVIYRRML